MTGSRTLLALGAAIGALLGSAALAGDFPELTPLESLNPDIGRGWYLRADAGYTFGTTSDGHFRINDPEFAGPNTIHYDELRLGWRHDLAVGAGYRFGEHLRGDLTLGHWRRGVDGEAYYSGINRWTYRDRASLQAWELLANAYMDVGRFGRFTPYLGAGVGVAHLKYGTLDGEAECDCGSGFTSTQPGRSSTRATWALMAGTAIDITPGWKLDVGYRFSRVEGGEAFGWDEADTAAGFTGAQTFDHGYDSHQLRVGLRKHFN